MSDSGTKKLQNWEEFEKIIEEERSECEKLKKKENSTFVDDLLFRGQGDADWKLLTSLERMSKKEWSCKQYYIRLDSITICGRFFRPQ